MQCIGHRGAKGHEPENTLRSIRRALELGADWIEIDVYCVEKRLVVIHDDTFNRTTNGRGDVATSSLEYLRSLDAGKGEKIPFLEEVFAALNRNAGLNIELKGPNTAEPTVNVVSQFRELGWNNDQILLSSFDPEQLRRARHRDSEVLLGVLVDKDLTHWPRIAAELGAVSVNPRHTTVNAAFVDQAHARGLKVYPWTVNDPHDIKRMSELAVDGVFSDYPDRVKELA